jgi:hypothetical protein
VFDPFCGLVVETKENGEGGWEVEGWGVRKIGVWVQDCLMLDHSSPTNHIIANKMRAGQ